MAEQRNYEKLLPTLPTKEEARQIWDRWKPTEYLIYRHASYREPITELKKTGVECICTVCRQRAIWPKVDGAACGRAYSSAPFGVLLPEGPKISDQEATCPECGAKVRLAHVRRFSPVIGQYSHWCTVSRFEDKLVFFCWVAQRDVCKDGDCLTSIKPYEAYVVEAKKVVRLKGYIKCMSSFRLTEEWSQVKVCSDTLGSVGNCLPWDPTILKGTAVENSKLDLYMQVDGDKYPVSYLRLYLKHPQVENLLTSGAGFFLCKQIASDVQAYWSSGYRAIPQCNGVNWREVKPAKMLGLNKDEFGFFLRQKWTPEELRLYQRFRKMERVKLPDDMELLRQSSPHEVNELIKEGFPVRRSIRYCTKHKESVRYLLDYWSMARAEGIDLNDDSLRWPKNLQRQHDKVVEMRHERWQPEVAARRQIEIAKRRSGFEKQYKKWSRLDFSANGILIRCCKIEEELVEEGRVLSHCVGNYAINVCTGSSVIFFIRRAESPDAPWFTLELAPKTLKVRQNRGKKNCDPPQEVKDFVALWIDEKIKKKESAA